MSSETTKKAKYHIITFGCQMNKSDSERLASLLNSIGFESTDKKEQADLILINTCSVRQTAEDRVFGQIHNFKKLKEKNHNLMIGITGCMPGRDRDGAIKKKVSEIVDFYFPTAEMTQLPRWIGELRHELINSSELVDDYLKIKPDYHSSKQAFVTIQTGCNNFCTYCVVPFARGLEKNRPVADVIKEVQNLAEKGIVEITLLGQTVSSFRAIDPENFSKNNPYKDHFAALLWEINQIQGISRLHFTAPHPKHMNNEIVDAMSLPAHLNFLHLPVQAGDNEVLRRMNRKHTKEDFFDCLDMVHSKLPNIALGTDLIVGFSGESREEFEKTVDLYKKAQFDIAYIAQYSERSGTAAPNAFKDDVPKDEKKRRWQVIQDLMEDIVYEKNQAFVGKTVSVLVERHDPQRITEQMLEMPEKIKAKLASSPGTCVGNSRELKLVNFPGTADLVGKIVEVKIKRAEKWILFGEKI